MTKTIDDRLADIRGLLPYNRSVGIDEALYDTVHAVAQVVDVIEAINNRSKTSDTKHRSLCPGSLEAELDAQKEVNETQAYTIRNRISSYGEGEFAQGLESEIKELSAYIERLEVDLRAHKEDSETLAKVVASRRSSLHGAVTCWYATCPNCKYDRVVACGTITVECPKCGHVF